MLNRFFSFLVLSFCALCTFGQNYRIGFDCGLSISKPKGESPLTGYHIGVHTEKDFSLNDTFFLCTSLGLASKGWSYKLYSLENEKDTYKQNCRLYYLELPLDCGYKFVINKQCKFLIVFGPYFGIGLFGKNKITNYPETLSDEGDPFKLGTYKRFDWGGQFGGGIEINSHYQITAKYSYSMKKPTKGKWNTLNPKDRTTSISCIYLF